MPVSFSLTALLALGGPDDEAAALATELRARGVPVPGDWPAAYREDHLDAPEGAAAPLPARVSAALRSRGVDPAAGEDNALRRATVAALDPDVGTRPGAPEAVAAAAARGAVGVLSAATVTERARRALVRSGIDREQVDATVTAAGCGWRPTDPRAIGTLSGRIGADPGELVHVGRNPAVAEAVAAAGARPVLVGGDDSRPGPTEAKRVPSLSAVATWLRRE